VYRPWLVYLLTSIVVFGCSKNAPPVPDKTMGSVVLSNTPANGNPPANSAALPSPSAPTPGSSAPPSDDEKAPKATGEGDDTPEDPANKKRPEDESAELTARAKALFEAIKEDKVDDGKDFFFPEQPFLKVKDIKKPGAYWKRLYKTYQKEIHQTHRRNKKFLKDGEFVSFKLGSKPKWIKPGKESNKIGYFRTFNGKIEYQSKGKTRHLGVRVIISWQNHWFITHLLPIKH
jgi:hypothetical protein